MISENLQERMYFKHAVAGVSTPFYEVNPFINFMGYQDYDWREYDFIIIDGPGPLLATRTDAEGVTWKTLAELPGGDLITLLPKMKEGTIVYIDGRMMMTHLFLRHLQHYLEVVEHGTTFLSCF